MSLKRSATTELNHNNWNDEDQPEEKGNFAQAPPEEIQNRVIKKAKRKLNEDEQGSGSKPIFSTFKGFGISIATASTVSSTSSPFSFLSKLSSSTTQQGEIKSATTTDNNKDKSKDFHFDHSTTYYAKLKALNQAVSQWIKQHVDENPLCILTPIFQDYEKYLVEIKDKTKNGSNHNIPSSGIVSNLSQASTSFKSPMVTTTNTSGISSSQSTFTFATIKSDNKLSETSTTITTTTTSTTSTTSTTTTNTATGATTATTTSSSIFPSSSKFSFAQNNDTNKGFPGFSFSSASSSKPFTFGNQVSPSSGNISLKSNEGNKDNTEDGDADDEPPKVEFKPIEEEGSIYSKRCKVFIKNDNYKDLGIGTLHLKPLKDKDKTQLIVRADTNIGKILLNLILNEGIPIQRMGKNNVMMICIPTPDAAEQKPVTVLLRVKTGEEADELLETINKYKK